MKKYIAICLCVLAICAVFGLNARLEYDEIKTAFESVEGTSETLQDDLSIMEILTFLVENFDTQSIYSVIVGDDFGNMNQITITRYEFDGIENWTMADRLILKFSSNSVADRMARLIRPMTWTVYDFDSPPFDNGGIGIFEAVLSAVNFIIFIFGIILTIIFTLMAFIFDAISTAWAIVRACIWILGFPITL